MLKMVAVDISPELARDFKDDFFDGYRRPDRAACALAKPRSGVGDIPGFLEPLWDWGSDSYTMMGFSGPRESVARFAGEFWEHAKKQFKGELKEMGSADDEGAGIALCVWNGRTPQEWSFCSLTYNVTWGDIDGLERMDFLGAMHAAGKFSDVVESASSADAFGMAEQASVFVNYLNDLPVQARAAVLSSGSAESLESIKEGIEKGWRGWELWTDAIAFRRAVGEALAVEAAAGPGRASRSKSL